MVCLLVLACVLACAFRHGHAARKHTITFVVTSAKDKACMHALGEEQIRHNFDEYISALDTFLNITCAEDKACMRDALLHFFSFLPVIDLLKSDLLKLLNGHALIHLPAS